jgi:hypothetical protein
VEDFPVGVRPRSRSLEPLAPALPLVVPGLGLGFGLGFASSDITVEDGSEDLVRVRRICSVLAAHEDCLPFCIYEGGSHQTSPPQTSQYNSDPYVRACCSRSWYNIPVELFARFCYSVLL